MPYDFYPRSPCGERHKGNSSGTNSSIFLSTLSLRRATTRVTAPAPTAAYFYPRSPCGERLFFVGDVLCTNPISIHALLAESDWYRIFAVRLVPSFLSTLSLRRATYRKQNRPLRHSGFLSTLSLRRATLTTVLHWYHISISIHALLAESDPLTLRPPAKTMISIHALLAESDSGWTDGAQKRTNFYPRSPCGERRQTHSCSRLSRPFLSTLSLRRATRRRYW